MGGFGGVAQGVISWASLMRGPGAGNNAIGALSSFVTCFRALPRGGARSLLAACGRRVARRWRPCRAARGAGSKT